MTLKEAEWCLMDPHCLPRRVSKEDRILQRIAGPEFFICIQDYTNDPSQASVFLFDLHDDANAIVAGLFVGR